MSDDIKPPDGFAPEPTDTQFWKEIKFWKLAIAKLTVKCVLVAFTTIAATLNGAEWSSFSNTQKFVAIGALVTAICGVIDAFLSDTMAKLQEKRKTTTL